MTAPVVSPLAGETVSEGDFTLTLILSHQGRGFWVKGAGTSATPTMSRKCSVEVHYRLNPVVLNF
jgi:hypothetical protein